MNYPFDSHFLQDLDGNLVLGCQMVDSSSSPTLTKSVELPLLCISLRSMVILLGQHHLSFFFCSKSSDTSRITWTLSSNSMCFLIVDFVFDWLRTQIMYLLLDREPRLLSFHTRSVINFVICKLYLRKPMEHVLKINFYRSEELTCPIFLCLKYDRHITWANVLKIFPILRDTLPSRYTLSERKCFILKFICFMQPLFMNM